MRRTVTINQCDLSDLTRSNVQLAHEFGVSEKAIRHRRTRAGIRKPSRREIDEFIVSVLAKKGKSDGEIAATLRCSPQGVNKARKRLGLKSLPRGRRPRP